MVLIPGWRTAGTDNQHVDKVLSYNESQDGRILNVYKLYLSGVGALSSCVMTEVRPGVADWNQQ